MDATSDLCPACDNTGFVRLRGRVFRCLCPAGRRVSIHVSPIDSQLKRAELSTLYHGQIPAKPTGLTDLEYDRMGIPTRYRSWTLDTWPGDQAVLKESRVDWWKRSPRPDLVLYGPPGTGKTGFAVGMLVSLQLRGHPGRFVDVAEWLLQLQATFTDDDISEWDRMQPLISPAFLVLDDLSQRRPNPRTGEASAYVAEMIGTVLRSRAGRNAPTIITMNLQPDEFAAMFPAQLYDRLRDALWWEFGGASWRGPKPEDP